MSTSTINVECFFYEESDDVKDFFTMSNQDDQQRPGYASLFPAGAPEVLYVPVSCGLDLLTMYTQDMKVLLAPPEICIRKALEFLHSANHMSVEVEIFRHDLTQKVIQECAFGEVDSLIAGILALADYLREFFTSHGLFIGSKLGYVFDSYDDRLAGIVMKKFAYYDGNTQPNRFYQIHHSSPTGVAVMSIPT